MWHRRGHLDILRPHRYGCRSHIRVRGSIYWERIWPNGTIALARRNLKAVVRGSTVMDARERARFPLLLIVCASLLAACGTAGPLGTGSPTNADETTWE